MLEAVPPAERRRLHRSALAALERAVPPVDVARLAHHAEEVGDATAVLRFSPAAGRAAQAVGAHRAVAADFARAVEHSHGLAPAERSELLALSAAELDELGHHDESVAAYHEAIELVRELR